VRKRCGGGVGGRAVGAGEMEDREDREAMIQLMLFGVEVQDRELRGGDRATVNK
jgi:hypothetical protein